MVLPDPQARNEVRSVYATAESDVLFHAEASQNFRVVRLSYDLMKALFPKISPQRQDHFCTVTTGRSTLFQTHSFFQEPPHKKPCAQRVIQCTPTMTSRTENTDTLSSAQRLLRGGSGIPSTGGEHGMPRRGTPKDCLRSVRRGEEQTHPRRTNKHFPG